MTGRRLEKAAIAALTLAVVGLPTAIHGAGSPVTALLLASGLTLLGWREHPRAVVAVGGGLWLAAAAAGADAWFPDPALVIMALLTGVAALAWTGQAAWVAGAGLAAYVGLLSTIVDTSLVAVAMFTVPSFFAGTVLRLRQEAAARLAERNRELEEERELFAGIAVRHERSRIAAELHDIVGHAISIMIIQAAAGQRLVDRDPARARETFRTIAESARQGTADLGRLVDLLGGAEVGGADLSLIEEVVTRAARSGLDVTCRFEGDRDGVTAPVSHLAFRVVRESLTNALRHAPGAPVRVVVTGTGRALSVRVENEAPTGTALALGGTGRGLAGLRERVGEQGGQLRAGPRPGGGWLVRADLPS
ncbi:sensor histidine kinase [Actinoplanes sp. M2I2]|uniref:sensor histidine kinase n=1 Tax=Actinoplanes sp. M2I2 TaxID=1734444 RepID=UPI002020159F|nr:histidine kinase [Actinoplanes sp. M2I2]